MKQAIIASSIAAACLASATAYGQARPFGTVVSATPVTTQVQVPRQSCSDQQGLLQAQPSGAGAVIGGVLGGLAGNAVGAGVGRALATGAGVIAGAVAGNAVETANAPTIPLTTTNCVYSRAIETRLIGYDVVYEFNGERYTTRTARDPGPRIALELRPAGQTAPIAPPASASPYDAPDLQASASGVVADVVPAAAPDPVPYVAPYPVAPYPAYPAYPVYLSYPAYPYPAYGYYGYPGIVIQGGFGGGWHGHRGR